MGILANSASVGLVQRPIAKSPQARAAKLTPMIIHGLPRRKIAREVAPRAARSEQIKERIEDGAAGVTAESAMRRSGRQELLEAVPLSIGQIAWIGIVHASECSSCCHYTFLQNTFSESLVIITGGSRGPGYRRRSHWQASPWSPLRQLPPPCSLQC